MEGLESPEGDETKTFEGSRVAELGSIDSKSIDRGSFFRSSIATRLDPPQSLVDHKSLVVKLQIRHLATRAFLSLRFRAWPRPLSSRTVVSLGRMWGLSPDLTTNVIGSHWYPWTSMLERGREHYTWPRVRLRMRSPTPRGSTSS